MTDFSASARPPGILARLCVALCPATRRYRLGVAVIGLGFRVLDIGLALTNAHERAGR